MKDESAAYLEFLEEEVGALLRMSKMSSLAKLRIKSQKFAQGSNDDDDDLEEESLLETPLDSVEPYGLFKDTLLS